MDCLLLLFMPAFLSQKATSKNSDPFDACMKYNLWKHLADVTNTSEFCLSQGVSAQEILSTYQPQP